MHEHDSRVHFCRRTAHKLLASQVCHRLPLTVVNMTSALLVRANWHE